MHEPVAAGRTRRVAVTGADGFVGARLCAMLEEQRVAVARLVRKQSGPGTDRRVTGDLETADNLDGALDGVDCIVHLAGRAHVLHETTSDPAAAFERANVDATQRLAQAAVRKRVARLVFVSSIHVNGTATHGRPFTESDEPAPLEPYGRSKLRAEQLLKKMAADGAFELVIVRPPLVYGPGAAGNFQRLLRIAARGVPLPLGSIRNRRSLIGVDNLAEFLKICSSHPAAVGHTFIAAEPQPRSTPELIAALAHAFGRRDPTFRCPEGLLRAGASLLGRSSEFEKLCGSLEASPAKAQTLLQWQPRVSFAEQLERVVSSYRQGEGRA